MPLNIPTFLTRTASAIVFVAIMLTGLLWNDWSFFVLIALIQVLCLREYFSLMKKIQPGNHQPKWLPIVVQLFALLTLCSFSPIMKHLPAASDYLTFFGIILFCFPIIIILFTALAKKTAWPSAMETFGSLAYITLPMIMLIELHEKNMVLPLGLIAMIWINDTMAYIVGSFIGKTPFSSISPKKTWEGTIGGIILTIAVAAVWSYYSPYANTIWKDYPSNYPTIYWIGINYPIIYWIGIALCASVAGTAGDLLESKLKRMANVKDSGMIMPGHGGALDRFDSLLVATPFAACLTVLFT